MSFHSNSPNINIVNIPPEDNDPVEGFIFNYSQNEIDHIASLKKFNELKKITPQDDIIIFED
jgi:hypothetical protein